MIKQGISSGLSAGSRTGAPRLFKVGFSYNEKAIALLLRMDATGESRPVAFDGHLNTLIQGLIDDELYNTQFDVLVNTRGGIGIGAATSKLNYIKNAHNAIGINSPTYVAGAGYSSPEYASSWLTTQFTPLTSIGLYVQNDACFIINGSGIFNTGATGGGQRDDFQNRLYFYLTGVAINGGYQAEQGGGAIGWNLLSRNNPNNIDFIKNGILYNINSPSSALLLPESQILGARIGNTPQMFVNTQYVNQLYGFGKSLSQFKFLKLQSRFNTFYSKVC